MCDVYCFGHVSTGTIVRLKNRFPAPDGYGEIADVLENHAGEAAGSAIVLSRLGATVTLEGNWIGDTPECRRTLAFLQSRGIDCAGLVVKPGYRGVTEIVISDGQTRTVFGRYGDLLFTTPQWELPSSHRICAAKIVCVDPSFGEATLAVARAAKSANRPLVTCDARADAPLAALAAVNIVSGEMIGREYPPALASDAAREQLFAEYLRHSRGLVVFTSGSRPLWYARGGAGATRRELAPFKVDVVDSAGAGDSFRGGVIHGMLRGWPDELCLQFASAVAALVCATTPGCVHPPTLDEVRRFLAERGIALPER